MHSAKTYLVAEKDTNNRVEERQIKQGYFVQAVGLERDFITDQPVFFAQMETPFLISAYP